MRTSRAAQKKERRETMTRQEKLTAIIKKGFETVSPADIRLPGVKVILTNPSYGGIEYFPKAHKLPAIKNFASRLLQESGDKVTIYTADHIYHDEAINEDGIYYIPVLSRKVYLTPHGDLKYEKWREEF